MVALCTSDGSPARLALQTAKRCVVGKALMLLSSFELPFPVFLGAMPVLGQTMFCTVHKADVILTSSSVPGENQAVKG